MTEPYRRTAAQKQSDFATARAFEIEVGTWLPELQVANLNHPDRLDYWLPSVAAEVKEKRQPLTPRWHLLPDVPEVDLFVIDELSVRRAASTPLTAGYPLSYFILRDVPGGSRVFLARVDELFSADRVRRNRDTKGKWVVDVTQFRQLLDPPKQLMVEIRKDVESQPWKSSGCLSMKEIGQI